MKLKTLIKSDDFDKAVGVAVRVEKFSDSSIDMRVRCFTTLTVVGTMAVS